MKKVALAVALFFALCSFALSGEGRFYYHSNFRGRVLHVGMWRQFAHMPKGWNDKISSYQIDDGVECVITKDSKFGGDYRYLGSGTGSTHMPRGWNDKVSSIMCAPEGYFTTSYESAAYEHAHYAGRRFRLTSYTYIKNLKRYGFNDVISSARLSYNADFACEFYKHANFKHHLFTLRPGQRYNRLSRYGFDNQISSIRCYPLD